jgi:hypothetical protein
VFEIKGRGASGGNSPSLPVIQLKDTRLKDQTSTTLSFVLKQDKITVLFPLLQEGFQVAAKVGCDIRSLLCDQFGLMPDYLADRISTIFTSELAAAVRIGCPYDQG